jgi:hypothetical protein
MTKDEFLPIWAFLIKQAGQFGSFSIAMPNQECRGSLSTQSNETLQTEEEITGNTVTIKNFNASQTNVVRVGDYFSFNGSAKLYIATADVDSNTDGIAIIPCYPNVEGTIAENTNISFEPVMNVGLVADNLNVDIPSDMTYNFNVEFIERV